MTTAPLSLSQRRLLCDSASRRFLGNLWPGKPWSVLSSEPAGLGADSAPWCVCNTAATNRNPPSAAHSPVPGAAAGTLGLQRGEIGRLRAQGVAVGLLGRSPRSQEAPGKVEPKASGQGQLGHTPVVTQARSLHSYLPWYSRYDGEWRRHHSNSFLFA